MNDTHYHISEVLGGQSYFAEMCRYTNRHGWYRHGHRADELSVAIPIHSTVTVAARANSNRSSRGTGDGPLLTASVDWGKSAAGRASDRADFVVEQAQGIFRQLRQTIRRGGITETHTCFQEAQ